MTTLTANTDTPEIAHPMPHRAQPFRLRGFITMTVAASFAIATITGAILFIVPPGRIANQTAWTLAGLTKADWQAIHIMTSILFVAAGGWHLMRNMKTFMVYARNKMASTSRLRPEPLLALALLLLVSAGAVNGWPPFGYVTDLNERAKAMWAEDGSLRMSTGDAKGATGATAATASTDTTNPAGAAADRASVETDSSKSNGTGRGYGRKTLHDLGIESGLGLDAVEANLAGRGLTVDRTDTIRTAAEKNGLSPSDLAAMAVDPTYPLSNSGH